MKIRTVILWRGVVMLLIVAVCVVGFTTFVIDALSLPRDVRVLISIAVRFATGIVSVNIWPCWRFEI